MNVYVISDIHGEYDLFMKMLEKISFSKDDLLIILGDVVDRGKDSIKILEYIMNKSNIEFILGNHEKMFLDFVLANNKDEEYYAYHLWMNNGGYPTLMDYDNLSNARKIDIIEYIKDASLYIIVGNYILVHAGVNVDEIKPGLSVDDIMANQSIDDLVWSREEFYKNKILDDYIVVFGHTPTPFLRDQKSNYDFSIWHDEHHKDKIGIDSGATFKHLGGYLSCLRLNDLKEYYV